MLGKQQKEGKTKTMSRFYSSKSISSTHTRILCIYLIHTYAYIYGHIQICFDNEFKCLQTLSFFNCLHVFEKHKRKKQKR